MLCCSSQHTCVTCRVCTGSVRVRVRGCLHTPRQVACDAGTHRALYIQPSAWHVLTFCTPLVPRLPHPRMCVRGWVKKLVDFVGSLEDKAMHACAFVCGGVCVARHKHWPRCAVEHTCSISCSVTAAIVLRSHTCASGQMWPNLKYCGGAEGQDREWFAARLTITHLPRALRHYLAQDAGAVAHDD
jgi:hypothetical protein